MGVPGLTTFLDANPQLLTDLKLRDISIVVDGNNLYHFLYNLYAIPIQYGGDYDVFYTAAKTFFRTLLKCGIVPIVVLDGPYNPLDKKIKTAVKRAKDRINQAQKAACGKKANLTPIFVHSVFISVLDDLGVSHVTCASEADSEIAALANTLRCPVLTNDSDFFIFDIAKGVVLLDYVNLELHTDPKPPSSKSQRYINVQIYYFHIFTGLFTGMHQDLLPLFATILGNEKVEAKTFDLFFASVIFPKTCSQKLFSGKKQERMVGVLSWLEACGSLDVAVGRILGHYPKEKQPGLRTLMMDSVDTYRNIQVSETYPYLEAKWTTCEDNAKVTSVDVACNQECNPSEVGGCLLPQWFISKLYAGQLSPLTINAAVSRQVILLTQPESVAKPASHKAALSLRRVLYGILLQGCIFLDRSGTTTAKRGMYVEEIGRDIMNQQRVLVEPKLELGGGHIPSLLDIPGLPIASRVQIVCEASGVTATVLGDWPANLRLYLAAVVCWISHSSLRLDRLHLSAVVICILKLAAIDKLANEISSDTLNESRLLETVRGVCTQADIVQVKENLSRYTKPSKGKNPSAQIDVSILHAFSELQACVMGAMSLNQALDSPLIQTSMDIAFNGTFLCNFYKELKSRSKPDLFIPELFNRSAELVKLFNQLMDSLKLSLKPGDLVMDLASGSKRSKKSKAKARGRQDQTGSGSAMGGSDRQENSMLYAASCDLANKFECLTLMN